MDAVWYGVDEAVARKPWLRDHLPFDQNDITPLFADEPWCTSTGRVRRISDDEHVAFRPGAMPVQFYISWAKALYAIAGRSNSVV